MNFLLFSSAHAQTITPVSPGFDFGGYGIWVVIALAVVGIFVYLKRNPTTVSSLTNLLHKQADTHAVVVATVPQALAATPAPVDVQAQINAAVAAALASRPGTPAQVFTPIPAATIRAVPAYGFDEKGQLLPGFMWDTRANGGKGGALTKAESDALSGISPAQAAAQEAAGAAAGNPASYSEEQNLLVAVQWDSTTPQPNLDLLATFGYSGAGPVPSAYNALLQATANANPLRNAANSMRRGLSPEQAVLASDNQITQDQADKLKALLVKYGQA